MKSKYIIIVSLMLAILTIGAASASDDISSDAISQEDVASEDIAGELAVNDVEDSALEFVDDELMESADSDVLSDKPINTVEADDEPEIMNSDSGYTVNATESVDVNSSKKVEVRFNVKNGTQPVDIDTTKITLHVAYRNASDNENAFNIDDFTYENGALHFTLNSADFTNATLVIGYEDGIANVTLNRIYNVNIEVVNAVNEYRTGEFKFRFADIDDSQTIVPKGTQLNLYIGSGIRAGFTGISDENGIVTFKNVNLYEFAFNENLDLITRKLEVGNYEVELSTSESNIKSKKTKVNLTIVPAHIKITIEKFEEFYGVRKNLTFNVTNVNDGTPVADTVLKLDVPQIRQNSSYLTTDSNGIARILIKDINSGTYGITVSNNDTKNIVNTSTQGNMTIKKIPVTIDQNNITVDYNDHEFITVKVTKDGVPLQEVYVYIKLYINSTKFEEAILKTGDDGEIEYSTSLNVGSYKLVVSMTDSRYESGEITKYFIVNPIDPEFNIVISNAVENSPIAVTVNANEAFNGDVTVNIAGNDVSLHIENGVGVNGATGVTLPKGNNYIAALTYESNGPSDNFISAQAETTFSVTAKESGNNGNTNPPQPVKIDITTNSNTAAAKKTVTFKVKKQFGHMRKCTGLFITPKVNSKAIKGLTFKIKIYAKGKLVKTITIKSVKKIYGKKNTAFFSTNALPKGTYKVKITINTNKYTGSKTTSIKIKKQGTFINKNGHIKGK